jgi:hypothetical protein
LLRKKRESTASSIGKQYLKDLIIEKWDEYDLDNNDIVPVEAIRARYKRGSFEVESAGRCNLLPDCVQKVIVDIVVAMAKIHHPLCVQETV